MEKTNNKCTPTVDQELWASPDMMFADHSPRQEELTSTPNLSSWPMLVNSAGSTGYDSGYCSQTPNSGESSRVISHLNYSSSTPQSCYLPKRCFEPSPHDLQTISEVKVPFVRHLSTTPLDSYEEAMDTSLYPDDVVVDGQLSAEGHQDAISFSEIDEEKSIDFVESELLISSCTPKNISRITEIKTNNRAEESGFDSEEFFSPETELAGCSTVSPKIKDRETPCKKESNYRNIYKKVGTLNWVVKCFSLNGIDKIDFFYQLGVKRNFPHIISKILSFLPEKDLNSVKSVSKTWDEIIIKDSASYNRWNLYSKAMQMKLENITSPTKVGSARRSVPFSPLHNLNNQINPCDRAVNERRASPRQNPAVSPDSLRFRSFQRAARSLRQGERLLQCPRCHFPSHDRGSPTVICSRSGCRHRFCVWCRYEVVSGTQHNCPPPYTPQLRRTAHKLPAVGSKSCKRNLRRL